jgi:hypothetical protein
MLATIAAFAAAEVPSAVTRDALRKLGQALDT